MGLNQPKTTEKMNATYKIIANQKNITDLVKQHLVSLSVKDSSGLDSDSLNFVLEDYSGSLKWPTKGVILKQWLSHENKLIYKGNFIVDELDYDASPNQIKIHCRAADIARMGGKKKTKYWGSLKLGAIIETIAVEYGLIPAISEVLNNIIIPNTFQIEESDLNFLSKISLLHGAIAQVKNGRLLLVLKGAKKTASGAILPLNNLDSSEVSRYRYSERRSDEFDQVIANYFILKNQSYQIKKITLGRGETTKKLATLYHSKEEAQAAAQTAYDALEAEASTLDINLEKGRPDFIAESRIKLSGFIEKINTLDWIVSDATHNLTSSGLTTTLKLIRPNQYQQSTS